MVIDKTLEIKIPFLVVFSVALKNYWEKSKNDLSKVLSSSNILKYKILYV